MSPPPEKNITAQSRLEQHRLWAQILTINWLETLSEPQLSQLHRGLPLPTSEARWGLAHLADGWPTGSGKEPGTIRGAAFAPQGGHCGLGVPGAMRP